MSTRKSSVGSDVDLPLSEYMDNSQSLDLDPDSQPDANARLSPAPSNFSVAESTLSVRGVGPAVENVLGHAELQLLPPAPPSPFRGSPENLSPSRGRSSGSDATPTENPRSRPSHSESKRSANAAEASIEPPTSSKHSGSHSNKHRPVKGSEKRNTEDATAYSKRSGDSQENHNKYSRRKVDKNTKPPIEESNSSMSTQPKGRRKNLSPDKASDSLPSQTNPGSNMLSKSSLISDSKSDLGRDIQKHTSSRNSRASRQRQRDESASLSQSEQYASSATVEADPDHTTTAISDGDGSHSSSDSEYPRRLNYPAAYDAYSQQYPFYPPYAAGSQWPQAASRAPKSRRARGGDTDSQRRGSSILQQTDTRSEREETASQAERKSKSKRGDTRSKKV